MRLNQDFNDLTSFLTFSCGASITPIVNDLEWTMWQRLDNSSLDYNIVILSDQSYILPTYNEQTNDYTLSRYTYNTTLISSFYSDIRFSANSSLSLLIIDTNKLVIYDNNQFILSLLNINTGNAIWSIDSTNCGGVKTASPPQYIYEKLWSLSKQVVSILDITLSGESSFYICSPDAIYLVDTSHATVKTLAFQANDNQTGLAYACKLSNAQSAIMAITSNLYDSNNNNETNKLEQNVILKISDSKCIELCSQNTTCTTDSYLILTICLIN
ncbi:hypothetical protein PPL_06128 [Heterostelium album PN500]|uniref:Uncharacterized protein n=1 Tax=Heterostelium pallidum (strain ATCC 26659 / Pp 5 / PN500) TaxID=670386 RepID=D3BCA3_HETP5|nr:hypothetical protein PPL_06128 [Heterostelium album PN500]EFA80893.1 hypothetical protein PPL_06128 [Heterostelium album PN500]|eukprot:XP_020433012.1 hypothetical protein PPL_06128 [Heterostelium album PN500]